MRLHPTLLALALTLAAVPAAAQTAAPSTVPARPGQPNQATARTTSPARPAAAAKPATASTAAAAAPATTKKAEPVDINTATSADLKAIPGIGDAYAAKIIARRPYHSKDELTRKKVLPAGVYAKVKDRIIARQH